MLSVNELEELHFELTYQCNQRCVMCNIWNRYKLNPLLIKEEISFNKINYKNGVIADNKDLRRAIWLNLSKS